MQTDSSDDTPLFDLESARAKLELVALAGYTLRDRDERLDYRAYRQLLRHPEWLRELQAELEQLSIESAPAVRIRAALLLERLEPSLGCAALERMVGSPEIIFTDSALDEWLGEVAGRMLGRPYADPRRLALRLVKHMRENLGDRWDAGWLEDDPWTPEVKQALAAHQDVIEEMTALPGPAGRLYSAIALRALGHPRASEILLRLATDPTLIWFRPKEAARYRSVTLGALARNWLPVPARSALPPAPRAPRFKVCPYNPLSRRLERICDRIRELARPVGGAVLTSTVFAVAIWGHFQDKASPHDRGSTSTPTTSGNRDFQALYEAARHARGNDIGYCPRVEQLLPWLSSMDAAPELRRTHGADRWGTLLRVSCDGLDIRVTSAGPDRKLDTKDDIRYPE